MCIYYSHWINLPDIFSSIKQNTQMPPLLLFSNCFIFSKRGTGSWRKKKEKKETFALWSSPHQAVGGEMRESRWGSEEEEGWGEDQGQGRDARLRAEWCGFPDPRGEWERGAVVTMRLLSPGTWVRTCFPLASREVVGSHQPSGDSGSCEMGSIRLAGICQPRLLICARETSLHKLSH